MEQLKVILDTNIIISAYFKKQSNSARVLKLASKEKIKTFWNNKMRNELNIILRNIHARQSFYKSIDKIYNNKNKIIRTPRINLIKEDPSDNIFLGLAKATQADFVVSSDHHLLKFKEFDKTRILKPSQFINYYNKHF
ncbi:MAG: putative toxin-antitoxin system toxin component, PIN family [Patescibacteria group bacterium]|nr:putative toxin-antitoxin system toxin component, PIN family [Patescibacteria group bacterium]